jgi:hypothetical protein
MVDDLRCKFVYPYPSAADRKFAGDRCDAPLGARNTSGYCMKHAPAGFSHRPEAKHITLNREAWEKARRPY